MRIAVDEMRSAVYTETNENFVFNRQLIMIEQFSSTKLDGGLQ